MKKSLMFIIAFLLTVNSVNPATTPLHYAAWSGVTPEIESLIARGKDVNARDEYDWRPLHCAVVAGHTECVQILLVHGANIDARNKKDETPLHIAAQERKLACVKILLAHGADIDAKDNKGKTPEDYAHHRGYSAIATLLQTARKKAEAEMVEVEEIKRFMHIQIFEE